MFVFYSKKWQCGLAILGNGGIMSAPLSKAGGAREKPRLKKTV